MSNAEDLLSIQVVGDVASEKRIVSRKRKIANVCAREAAEPEPQADRWHSNSRTEERNLQLTAASEKSTYSTIFPSTYMTRHMHTMFSYLHSRAKWYIRCKFPGTRSTFFISREHQLNKRRFFWGSSKGELGGIWKASWRKPLFQKSLFQQTGSAALTLTKLMEEVVPSISQMIVFAARTFSSKLTAAIFFSCLLTHSREKGSLNTTTHLHRGDKNRYSVALETDFSKLQATFRLANLSQIGKKCNFLPLFFVCWNTKQ